jgi:hypothetical protein
MSHPTIKYFRLTRDQVTFMYAMVRVTEIKETFRNQLHDQVAKRLFNAKCNLATVCFVSFSTEERQLLRDYNTTYCANLSMALLDAETNSKVKLTTSEALEIYALATRIHHLLR